MWCEKFQSRRTAAAEGLDATKAVTPVRRTLHPIGTTRTPSNYVGTAYAVMAYIVMAHIVMAYTDMAYIVMARSRQRERRRLRRLEP